ncbi:unnamed protein product, partial [Vitis vinifera]
MVAPFVRIKSFRSYQIRIPHDRAELHGTVSPEEVRQKRLSSLLVISFLLMELQFSFFPILCTFLLFIYLLKRLGKPSRTNHPAPKLPPGPWKLPIIGNMHQLVGSLPHRSLRSLAKKHGPLMHLQLGEVSAIVVSSREMAKEVMKTHDIIFSQRPCILAASIVSYDCTDIAFAPYGVSLQEGVLINLTKSIFSLTFSIISRTAFGKKCKDQEAFSVTLDKFADSAGETCEAEVDDDLVDVLLKVQKQGDLEFPLTMDNIKAVLLDLFVAGTETSSTAVEWAMAEMLKNPRVMAKAQAEVRDIFSRKGNADETVVRELKFLKLVIKETLRLHPPVPLPSNHLTQLKASSSGKKNYKIIFLAKKYLHLRISKVGYVIQSCVSPNPSFYFGPWKLPIIGNMHQLVGSLPHHSLRNLAKKHGPLMHLQLGEVSAIVVSSREMAKEVMKTHDIIFSQRPCILAASIRVQSFRSVREEEVLNLDQEAFSVTLEKFAGSGGGFTIADVFPSIKLLHVVNEDLVDVLLKVQKQGDLEFPLTTDNIKAILLDLFIAGSETSSTAVEWAMAEMLKNPGVMAKAQAEVRDIFSRKGNADETMIHELKFLKLVIKETLRLHPPVPLLIPRESRESCEINGYEIPVKTRVIINAWAVARDPEHWNDAESFNPERFLDSSIDYQGTNFEYIPFGAGRRMCPGILFGMANVEIALAQLLYYFDWKLPNGTQHEELDMTEDFRTSLRRKLNLHLIPITYQDHHSVRPVAVLDWRNAQEEPCCRRNWSAPLSAAGVHHAVPIYCLKAPRGIYQTNIKLIFTKIFSLFTNLKTKESCNWWFTRSILGFRQQKTNGKYLPMSVASFGRLQEPFRRRKMVSAKFRRHLRGLRNIFATPSYLHQAAKLASILRFLASLSWHGSCIVRRRNTLLYKTSLTICLGYCAGLSKLDHVKHTQYVHNFLWSLPWKILTLATCTSLLLVFFMELHFPSFHILSAFILFLVVVLRTQKRSKTGSLTPNLPPGPWKLPLVGNIHQLVGSLPHHALRDLAKKYEVMKSHDIIFAQRPHILATRIMSYNSTNIAFAPYGDYWRHLRKICMSELLSANRVQSFQSIRNEEESNLVRSISLNTGKHSSRFSWKLLSWQEASTWIDKDGPDEDLVDVLLKFHEDHGDHAFSLTTDNIKAVLLDIFGAGSEPSSTTIDFAMSEMMRNPRIMRKAQEEVRRIFDRKEEIDEMGIQELKFLKLIPVKSKIIVNAWAIGRDPKHWTEPESFNPERFLDSSIDYKGTNFEYIPFGAGRRICPGILFGLASVELLLAKLLYHFDWKLPNGMKQQDLDMTEVFGLAVRRKEDLYLIPTAYYPLSHE